MSHGTPRGNAGHPKILAAPTSDHTGSCAGIASPSAACRKRGGLRLRLCTGPGAELVSARLGGGAFMGGPVLRGHPAGSLESRRQVCCSGPGRAAHSGCPANCSRRTAEEDTHGPLAQALPCSHSTVAARSTPLVCLLRGSGSSAGSVCIPGTRALPVYSRCSINTLVAWTGVSSAHLWGFCGGWYRRGLEGNPATSHVHPSVLKAGGAGLSGGQWVQRCPEQLGKGWELGSPCRPPGLGGPDLETEHAHLGESPFRNQLTQEAEQALLGLKALGEGVGGGGAEPLPSP